MAGIGMALTPHDQDAARAYASYSKGMAALEADLKDSIVPDLCALAGIELRIQSIFLNATDHLLSRPKIGVRCSVGYGRGGDKDQLNIALNPLNEAAEALAAKWRIYSDMEAK